MFLNIEKGVDVLTEMHDILYAHEFSKYRPAWLNAYAPHITVGVFNTEKEARNAHGQEKEFGHVFSFLVRKIHVEIIGNDEESIIEAEYLLRPEVPK